MAENPSTVILLNHLHQYLLNIYINIIDFDVYPKGISIDTTGKEGSINHEFLHLFGVLDGYEVHWKMYLCLL